MERDLEPFETVQMPPFLPYFSFLEPKVEMTCPDEEIVVPEDPERNTDIVRGVIKTKCKDCNRLIMKCGVKSHSYTYWGLRESSCALGSLLKTKENKNPIKRTSPVLLSNNEQNKQQKQRMCPVCQKLFQDLPALRRHTVNEHLKNVVFSCHECDIKFSQLDQLKKHQVKVHGWGSPGNKSNKISVNKLNKNDKLKAKRQVARSIMFICKFCNQDFISQYCLSLHLRKFHKMKLNCEHCDFSSRSKLVLSKHMLNLHNDPYSYNLDLFFE